MQEPEMDLFGNLMEDAWKQEWVGMPEFVQEDANAYRDIIMHFDCEESVKEFSKLVGQNITEATKYLWFPKQTDKLCTKEREWSGGNLQPSYPIYVISKGRWSDDTRLTSIALEKMNVPYRIVIEPQEYEKYSKVIDPKKILQLPEEGYGKGCSIPARNWVWEHSISEGYKRHWVMDDNMDCFWRLNRNHRHPVTSGTIFRCTEEFVDRYENVAISGLQYFMFAPSRESMPPFALNTRIYSCILIQNDIKDKEGKPYRWRGRYNEDTDLSIRVLKDGWCTILFYAFLTQKAPTGTISGGNMEQIYGGNEQVSDKGKEWIEKRRLMAQSLVEQHPDIVTVAWKWDRPQHQVDYSGFKKNKLIKKPGVSIPQGVNEYGMVLKKAKV